MPFTIYSSTYYRPVIALVLEVLERTTKMNYALEWLGRVLRSYKATQYIFYGYLLVIAYICSWVKRLKNKMSRQFLVA